MPQSRERYLTAAGVERFVYVSVASIVPEVVGATPLMKGYFAGKVMAGAPVHKLNAVDPNLLNAVDQYK